MTSLAMGTYGVLLGRGTYWAKHPITDWGGAVLELTGGSTTKGVRVKTNAAEICEDTVWLVWEITDQLEMLLKVTGITQIPSSHIVKLRPRLPNEGFLRALLLGIKKTLRYSSMHCRWLGKAKICFWYEESKQVQCFWDKKFGSERHKNR